MLSLNERVERVLADVSEHLGLELPSAGDDEMAESASLIELALDLVTEHLTSSVASTKPVAIEFGTLLLELHRTLLEVHANARSERLDALSSVYDGLSRLRRLHNVPDLIENAPRELCRSCGFDRALLLRIEPGCPVVLEAQHGHPDERALGRRVAGELATAGDQLLEEGADRMRGARRRDESSAVRTALSQVLGGVPFVLAPVLCSGNVIGVLEADFATAGRSPQRLHRDALAAFAAGLGTAVERVALTERLHLQRDHVRRLVEATAVVADDLCNAQIKLSRDDDPSATFASAAKFLAPDGDGLGKVLSPREAEVMRAMSSGATNSEIAELLFISDDTVKTHVKHILRKLGAGNRVEAVSRFVRLATEAELSRASEREVSGSTVTKLGGGGPASPLPRAESHHS